MTEKHFTCEYYQVMEKVPNQRDAFFDLEAWINDIKDKELKERTYPYLYDKMRLEEVYFHETYQKWFLRFMRIKPNDIPSLSGDNTPSEFMDLEEDQYVSEEIVCLYDPEYHVLMIQKNMGSITPTGVQMYLNLSTDSETVINLRRVISKDSFQRARRATKSRKIIFRFADLPMAITENRRFGSTIGRIVRSMKVAPSPHLELTLSVGMSRSAEIDEDEVNSMLSDLEANPTFFDKAQIQVIEDGERKSETINLIENCPKDIITVTVEGRNPIRFDALMDKMGNKYCPGEGRDNRRLYIINCITKNK